MFAESLGSKLMQMVDGAERNPVQYSNEATAMHGSAQFSSARLPAAAALLSSLCLFIVCLVFRLRLNYNTQLDSCAHTHTFTRLKHKLGRGRMLSGISLSF